MANEKGRNKKKREEKRIARLKRFIGVDLCACSGGHKMVCHGSCREGHTNPNTNRVECGEIYQIDQSAIKSDTVRRPKRSWRFGRQKEGNENRQGKQHRREKIERDRQELSTRGV